MSHKHWYVVQTKPRKENLAEDNLHRQGFVTYCPYTVQSKRLRQRWQKVFEPLFPRYLFVQLNIGVDSFSPIRSTLGVVGLVKFGDSPAIMPNALIDAIQQQELEMQHDGMEHPNWQSGDTVEIIAGPFSGLLGIFHKKDSNERVSLLLNILGRHRRVVINMHEIIPAT